MSTNQDASLVMHTRMKIYVNFFFFFPKKKFHSSPFI